MARFVNQSLDIEEDLRELEQNLNRLRVAYDQYFAGALKREPQDLRGRVQKTVTHFTNEPPRNAGQKFRFNQLNARFQSLRQLWGRIMRQIEAGTYAPQRFRAKLHERPPEAPPAVRSPSRERARESAPAHIERLARALASARLKTGESRAPVPTEKLARIVKKQTEALREKFGAGKVRFRVVIENDRAKLKASYLREPEG